MLIYHITSSAHWEKAIGQNFYSQESLAKEGVIRCSFVDQIAKVAHRLFSGISQLVLLEMSLENIIPEVKTIEVGGEKFPHIYGPLNLNSVIGVHKIEWNDLGEIIFPKNIFVP